MVNGLIVIALQRLKCLPVTLMRTKMTVSLLSPVSVLPCCAFMSLSSRVVFLFATAFLASRTICCFPGILGQLCRSLRYYVSVALTLRFSELASFFRSLSPDTRSTREYEQYLRDLGPPSTRNSRRRKTGACGARVWNVCHSLPFVVFWSGDATGVVLL